MDEREKEIAQTIAEAVPKMDDFTKGYLLGQVEAMAHKKETDGPEESVRILIVGLAAAVLLCNLMHKARHREMEA